MVRSVFPFPVAYGIERDCAPAKKILGVTIPGNGAIWCIFVLFKLSCGGAKH